MAIQAEASGIGSLENPIVWNVNSIENLDTLIKQNPGVHYLKIVTDLLKELPYSIGSLRELRSLKVVTSGERSGALVSLPDSVKDLGNLRELEVKNQQLTTLPTSIEKLQSLKSLLLNKNHLRILPPQIGQLQKLTTLNVHDNDLLELPEELGNARNLTDLDAGSNALQSLPYSLLNLPLQKCDVSGNDGCTMWQGWLINAFRAIKLLQTLEQRGCQVFWFSRFVPWFS